MTPIAFIALTILPGAWITCGLPFRAFSAAARLALAVALSPVVLACQYVILRLVGLEFGHAAWALLLVNLPAAVLVARHSAWQLPRACASAWLAGFLVCAVLLGSLVLPWVLVPDLRQFSWHALLHTDVIYALARTRLVPEEPELAGLTLAYDWIGSIYWGSLAWLADWSPTQVYPVTNVIWLLVTCVLAFEVGRAGLGLHRSTSIFGAGLLMLGSQAVGVAGWVLAGDTARWHWALGSVNNTAMLNKYQGFEDIPFAFALLVGLTLVCLVAMRTHVRFLAVLLGSLTLAVGLVYPILFPMACLLSGGTLLVLASGTFDGVPRYSRSERSLVLVAMLLSIATAAAFLGVTTRDREVSVLDFLDHGRQARAIQVVTTTSVFALLALPSIVGSLGSPRPSVVLLTATAGALGALYVVVRMSESLSGAAEDKLLYGCAIALAPLAAEALDSRFRAWPRARWAVAVAVPAALAVLNSVYVLRLGAGVPPNLAQAPRIDEGSFWLALARDEPDGGWTRAVRDRTPADTVVVAIRPGVHLAPYVARSLYFPNDYDERSVEGYTAAPAGYSVDKRFFLLQQRGYSRAVWDERRQVVQSLYTATDAAALTARLAALTRLERPLAIHFGDDAAPALAWLRRAQIGTELYSDTRNVVWYVDAPAGMHVGQ